MTLLHAEDNDFPSVMLKETAVGAIAVLPPAGSQRLIVNPSDHLLYLVNSAGVATLVGGGGGGGAGVATGGSTGQALIKASGTDYDTAWGGTSVGLALLEAASQSAGRTALGLGSAATSASSAFDAAGAAAAAQSASQPLDSDLTAIAAIAPTNNDVIQRKAGAWTNRTIAQLLTDLGVTALTVEEVDGSPTDAAVTKIVFPNGTLSFAGHVATFTPAGGGSSGLVLLEEHTASGSASLDFTTRNVSGQSGATFQSDFDDYQIEIIQIVPASGTPVFNCTVSTDGGSTFDGGANHYHTSHLVWSNSGSAVGGGLSTSIQVYPYAGRAMTTSLPASGHLKLFNPLGTTAKQLFEGKLAGGDSVTAIVTQTLDITGSYEQLAAFNALRFAMSGGINIAAGTIRILGIPK